MPYSKGNRPAAIRGLPEAAQTLWIKVFNDNYDRGEDKARIAAWGAVKGKYRKQGEKWVAKSQTTRAFSEGKIKRDSKGRFAPKGSSASAGSGGKTSVKGVMDKMRSGGWGSITTSGGAILGESGDLQLVVEPKHKMTSVFDAARDVELHLTGVKVPSVGAAKKRLKEEYPDEYRSIAMSDHGAMQRLELIITKAAASEDGHLRWVATCSTTDPDKLRESTSLSLFEDWIERAESGVTERWLPEPRMPFLSVAHFPELNGLGLAGTTTKLYIDGNRFKAAGVYADTLVGKASYQALRDQLQEHKAGATDDAPIRISAAWWDVSHKHGDFVFTRKSLTDECPICKSGTGQPKTYLLGQLDHFAQTRVPIHGATDMTLVERSEKRRVTRLQDAASIVGEDLAELLQEAFRETRAKRSGAEPDVEMSDAGDPDVEQADIDEQYADQWFGGATTLQEAHRWEEIRDLREDLGGRWRMLTGVMSNILATLPVEQAVLQAQTAINEFGGELGELVSRADYYGGDHFGGAIELSTALDWLQEHPQSAKRTTGWSLVVGLTDNVLRLPGEEAVEVLRSLYYDLEEQVDELTRAMLDRFLGETLKSNGGDDMEEHDTDVLMDVEEEETEPIDFGDLDSFPEEVRKVLSDSTLSPQAKLQAIQPMLEGVAGAIRSQVETGGDATAMAVERAVTRSLTPLTEQMALLLARMGGQAPTATDVPVRKSFSGGNVVNDPATRTSTDPVSRVTGEPSGLTAIIRRSVGLTQ